MKIKFYYILLILVPTILWGQSTYESRRAAHDKEYLKTYEHSRLGFKFTYYSDFEDFPDKFDIDTTSWKCIHLSRFGISFYSPKPYSIRRKPGYFSGRWQDPVDTVTSLDFGGGVSVNIFETHFRFHEIAFAEGFYQYIQDSGFHPEGVYDSLPKIINDSAWVTNNCGVPFGVKNLFGYSWKGLRGHNCYSENLPMEMGGSPAYGDYVHAFVVHPTSHNTMLVFVFSNEPDRENKRVNILDEIMFYELISSVNWEHSKNIK